MQRQVRRQRNWWNATSALDLLLIVVIAVVTMMLFHQGIVVRDARYEHIAAPWQFLVRHLTVWDDARGPGVPAQYFSPVVGAFQSLLSFAGAPAWMIGRLTLALYLSVAGIGAWYLWGRLWPVKAHWSIVVGLLYAFNPYTSQAIIPSGLFLPVALLPWLVAFTYDGVRAGTKDGWPPVLRSAAACALAVFTVGMLNTAALLFVLVPVALFGFLLVLGQKASWRGLVRFGVPAAALTLLVSAPMLNVLLLSSPVVSRNLATTELATGVAQSSSSFESWRGLGHWLSYFLLGGGLSATSAERFMTNPIVILCSFVSLAFALVALGWRRTPLRRTWGALLALTIVVMVGAHSPEASPIGAAFNWAFTHVGGVVAFRSTFKAGAMAILAVAVLATSGFIMIFEWLTAKIARFGTKRLATVVFAVVIALPLVVSAYPFLGGSLLGDNLSVAGIPQYWQNAFRWFDRVPESDRVLVLPAESRSVYTWGEINDTLFDAFMKPQVLTASSIPSTTKELADATVSFDRLVTQSSIDPSAIAPILQWLGVKWVLLQNDIDLYAGGFPNDMFSEFRNAPGVSPKASFGVDFNGKPIVEVLRVDDPQPSAALWNSPPSVVVGGTDSLYSLAANGFLDRPTTFLDDLTDKQTDELLSTTYPALITDGSRRVASRVSDSRLITSPLLTENQNSSRPIFVLNPDDTSTQTVALYDNALGEYSDRSGNSLDDWSSDTSASAAFDDNNDTAWWVLNKFQPAEGTGVWVDLAKPTYISSVNVSRYNFGDAVVTGASVEVTAPDGLVSRFEATFDQPTIYIPVDSKATRLRFEITATNALAGRVGFSSIVVDGLNGPIDLVQWTRVPTAISRMDVEAPVEYAFARAIGEIQEAPIRRQFDVPSAANFQMKARVSAINSLTEFEVTGFCNQWFAIDGIQISARITSYDQISRIAELQSCAPVRLEAGTHRLVARGPADIGIEAVSLTVGATDPVTPLKLKATRVSSTKHQIELPTKAGWMTTLIPAHFGWKIEAGSRKVYPLVMNAEEGWYLSSGEAVNASITFRLQVLYEAAMVVAIVALIGCVGLQFWRRRAKP